VTWTPLPSAQLPPLEAGVVHLVHLPLLIAPEPGLHALLSAPERERASRFAFARDRERYVLARATLRRLLGSVLGLAPEALRFSEGPFGKPALAPAQALRFNLSHSGEHALYAFGLERELGVDLELARAEVDVEGVGRLVFSAQEQRAFAALPEAGRRAAFFQLWARKEALIKAEGTGFAEPSADFTLTVDPREPPRLLAHTTRPGALSRWSLCDVDMQLGGYAAALAVEGPPPQLRGWQLAL
jgi:4'-phosphopantetheinyl transferase